MSASFHVRPATPADADMIAWHRARMFQDMGDVPPELFDEFRAKAKVAIEKMLARGDYVGWLASPDGAPDNIIGGAGLQLQQSLPRPFTSVDGTKVSDGRLGIIINVFTEPEWRRRGVAERLLRRIIEWARAEHVDRIILHASDEGRSLYKRLGFVVSNEMRLREQPL
jgi:GNAT superfamily N-acetyltransferase